MYFGIHKNRPALAGFEAKMHEKKFSATMKELSARINAAEALEGFGEKKVWSALTALLGYHTYGQLVNRQTEDDTRKLEILAGPHGYTYYRALQALKSGK